MWSDFVRRCHGCSDILVTDYMLTHVSQWIEIWSKENNGTFQKIGMGRLLEQTGSCNLTTIQKGSNYTIRIRYVRIPEKVNHYYYGEYGYQTILATYSKAPGKKKTFDSGYRNV